MNEQYEERLRGAVRHLAAEPASERLRVRMAKIPAEVPSPANRNSGRAWTSIAVGLASVAIAVVLVSLAIMARPLPPSATAGPSSTSPTIGSPAPLPAAARLVGAFDELPDLMVAAGGSLIGADISQSTNAVTVVRIDPDGNITRRAFSDADGYFLTTIALLGNSIYVATNAPQRISTGADEIVRIDATTLLVTKRAPLPGGAIGLAAGADGLWVATSNQVLRLNPDSLAIDVAYTFKGFATPPAEGGTLNSIAFAVGKVWVTSESPAGTAIDALDLDTLRPASHVDLGGTGGFLTGDATSLWVVGESSFQAVSFDGTLAKPVIASGLQGAAARADTILVLLAMDPANEALRVVGADGETKGMTTVGDAGGKITTDGSFVWLLNGSRLQKWELLAPAS